MQKDAEMSDLLGVGNIAKEYHQESWDVIHQGPAQHTHVTCFDLRTEATANHHVRICGT
jgi:hypothetical protein